MGRLLGLLAFVWASWTISRTVSVGPGSVSIGISGNGEYLAGRLIGLAIAVVIVFFAVGWYIALYAEARSRTKDSGSSYPSY